MSGIPPAKDSDAEDVVWGLQTAEALWKRGERLDAIVWLRRAAQAAGEATDDDRALELARFAAELSESMSTVVPPGTSAAPPPPDPPPYDATTTRPYTSDLPPPNRLAQPAPPHPAESEPQSEDIPIDTGEPSDPHAGANDATHEDPGVVASDPMAESRKATSVPPADMVHAGMFNPWDEGRASVVDAPPPAPPVPAFQDDAPRFASEEEEVVTSVRPHALAQQQQQRAEEERERSAPPGVDQEAVTAPPAAPLAPAAPAAPKAPLPPRPAPGARKPPPLPPRALKKPPIPTPVPEAPPVVEAAPPTPEAESPVAEAAPPPEENPIPPAPPTDPSTPPDAPPSAPADIDEHTPVHSYDARQIAAISTHPSPLTPPPPAPPPSARLEAPAELDLENVESFADLPDDARLAFAKAATLSALGESEEVSHFALAYVIEGSVDVAATMVDAPALRLTTGAVLRSKGTTEEDVPMRLIGTDGGGVVATWSAAAVTEAFRTIPWVEDDLRAAADKVLTLVGITIGPLGERLDASIREHIVGLMTMRSLAPGEVVVTMGEVVPGLLLIGVGELELVNDDKVSGVVGCGDFLFAGEVLGAGSAPSTARAGTGGALILFGDRLVAQELLVTCPPLVEVLAGM